MAKKNIKIAIKPLESQVTVINPEPEKYVTVRTLPYFTPPAVRTVDTVAFRSETGIPLYFAEVIGPSGEKIPAPDTRTNPIKALQDKDKEAIQIFFSCPMLNINQTDKNGNSIWFYAVDYALQTNDVSVMNFLIERGINVNQKDEYGRTAVHIASWHPQVMAVLRDKADLSMYNPDGRCYRSFWDTQSAYLESYAADYADEWWKSADDKKRCIDTPIKELNNRTQRCIQQRMAFNQTMDPHRWNAIIQLRAAEAEANGNTELATAWRTNNMEKVAEILYPLNSVDEIQYPNLYKMYKKKGDFKSVEVAHRELLLAERLNTVIFSAEKVQEKEMLDRQFGILANQLNQIEPVLSPDLVSKPVLTPQPTSEQTNQVHSRPISTEGALYEGQTTQELSANEMNLLLAKLDLNGLRSQEQKNKVISAFYEMAKYPTGRVQIREILASPISPFKISCNQKGDKYCDKNGCYGFNNKKNGTTLSSKTLAYDKTQLGICLLHEMRHERSIDFGNSVLDDMETQALERQLFAEVYPDKKWINFASYRESYQKIVQKWQNIVNDPQRYPRPAWAPEFKAMPDVTGEKLAQAKDAYIQQMAARETMALFMQDFTMSKNAMVRGDFKMPTSDYSGFDSHLFYDSKSIRERRTNFDITQREIQYLTEHYPELNIAKIKNNMRELKSEYQLKEVDSGWFENTAERHAKAMRHTDVFTEVAKHPLWRSLGDEGIAKLSDSREIGKVFDKIMDSNLSVNGKFYFAVQIIGHHKDRFPAKNSQESQERREMIEKLRDLTGFNLMFVQNSSSGLETLHQCGETVPEETSGTILIGKTSGYNIT